MTRESGEVMVMVSVFVSLPDALAAANVTVAGPAPAGGVPISESVPVFCVSQVGLAGALKVGAGNPVAVMR